MSMRRIFTLDDQDFFARLSGDFNPMHMDPVAARRTLFGRPVVHGIHTLLCAIEGWLALHDEPVRLRTLQVAFRGPVIVGEPVEIMAPVAASSGKLRFEIVAHGVKLLSAALTFETDR